MTFLIVIASILAYVVIGGAVGARHHAIASRTCNVNHFSSYWCTHVYVSVWLYGLLWPFALPATAGVLIGLSDRDNRTQRRHTRELAEAKHKAALAREARVADEELDRQLEAQRRQHAPK
jgi:hypothetical protein